MSRDWGTGGAGQFTTKTYTSVYPTINPIPVKLPPSFVVCVVGASRGIGTGIATSYTKAGASDLILASRRTSGLEEAAKTCKQLNPEVCVRVIPCDITSAQSVAVLAESVRSEFGRLDVLAINSGYSGPCLTRITDVDPSTMKQASEVNYIGTFLCAKFFIPLLLGSPNGAKAFVIVSSMAALLVRGPIANAQYCVSKMAQLKLMEHVHEEYAPEGLVAYSVHPGAVATEQAIDTSPEVFVPYLTDSPELCGAFIVWLTKPGTNTQWLSGRLLSAKWDADELQARKEEIIEKDLLKTKLVLGNPLI